MRLGETFDEDIAELGEPFADRLHKRGDEYGGIVVEDVDTVPDGSPAQLPSGFGQTAVLP